VRPEAKQLASPLSVNLNYNATGQNALQGILPYSIPPAAAGGKGAMIGPVNRGQTVSDARLRDSALHRTAQSAPSVPASFNLPQPPPFLNSPVLQSPNVGSEAEQVARMLTGQPFNPNQVQSTLTSQLGGTPASAVGNQVGTTLANAATAPPGQPIIVMPAPVVVMPPKPDIKNSHSKSRLHQALKKLGNRVNQGMDSLRPPTGQ
jgi:hypothetical protein